jgi:hypothetical protein
LTHGEPLPDEKVRWDYVNLADWRALCAQLTGLPAEEATIVADHLLDCARHSIASSPSSDNTIIKIAARARPVNALVVELILSNGDEVCRA